jgi:hypothetical protein
MIGPLSNKSIAGNQLVHAIAYFFFSTILTWWFVLLCPLYISRAQMILSTSIAGGKWAIQIALGILLLRHRVLPFIRSIGLVCFIGSILLVPYIISASLRLSDHPRFFFASLAVAVIVMVIFYYSAMKKIGLGAGWWLAWIICLVVAITLQLTLVFEFL